MLAQSFLPAADLGLTDEQRSALIKTLALMDGGHLVHIKTSTSSLGYARKPAVGLFNMDVWQGQAECGTVCCIAGHAEAIAGKPIFITNFTDNLDALFFPDIYRRPSITVPQAAMALRSYLTTGDARWDLALADHHSSGRFNDVRA